ncbi:DUF6705 family protein [Flavobacterium poyangense]|uniref:DUF6705 family protein n=1 Tax=Flavobacterium poyangense TaxID=2204302 RepID=UPI00141F8E39|nr:DUF6705 family protein [Flavobacterium sp. JXAS1]
MKNYFNFAVFFILLNSCMAQNPVRDIMDVSFPPNDKDKGVYFKDTKNVLNGYDGTYLYTNGTKLFKIKLQKNVMINNGYNYEDLIVGEYQLIENGVEKVNTLDRLTSTSFNNNISGSLVLTGTKWGCNDCRADEKRLRLGFIEATSPHIGEIEIRKTTVGGKDAILVNLWYSGPIIVKEGAPKPKDGVVRAGEYIMIKQ